MPNNLYKKASKKLLDGDFEPYLQGGYQATPRPTKHTVVELLRRNFHPYDIAKACVNNVHYRDLEELSEEFFDIWNWESGDDEHLWLHKQLKELAPMVMQLQIEFNTASEHIREMQRHVMQQRIEAMQRNLNPPEINPEEFLKWLNDNPIK